MAAAQEELRHGRIFALGAAIRRLHNGEFGGCEDCGEFIGGRRLDLDPTLVRCRNCAGMTRRLFGGTG